MDYQCLEKTAMCYRCIHKEICKTVYMANDLGIQNSKWDCSKFTEEGGQKNWIPTTKKNPKEMQEVFIWFEYYNYNYNCMYQTCGIGYVCGGQWSPFINGESGWKDFRVIAWMPFPEPDEMEEI